MNSTLLSLPEKNLQKKIEASKRVGVVILGKSPKIFDYWLPDHLLNCFCGKVPFGHRVVVSFRRRLTIGILVHPERETGCLEKKLLEILWIIDRHCLFSPHLLQWIEAVSLWWSCPFEKILAKALPSFFIPPPRLSERCLVWVFNREADSASWCHLSLKNLKASLKEENCSYQIEEEVFPSQKISLSPCDKCHEIMSNPPVALRGHWNFRKKYYLEKIEKARNRQETILFLFPTIDDLSACVKDFSSERLYIYHSYISLEQRQSIWKKAYEGEYCIIFGLPQALWLPFRHPIHLVMERENSEAYRDLREPGIHLREMILAPPSFFTHHFLSIVLGIDFPSLELIEQIRKKKIQCIAQPILQGHPPQCRQLPRSHLNRLGKFSPLLIARIRHYLIQGSRVIILASYQGSAQKFYCLECQEFLRCPFCKRIIVGETVGSEISCLICRSVVLLLEKCQECGEKFVPMGIGTAHLTEQLRLVFNDHDVLTSSEKLDRFLEEYSSKKYISSPKIVVATMKEWRSLIALQPSLVIFLGIDAIVHTTFADLELRWMERCWMLHRDVAQFHCLTELIFLTNYPTHPLIQSLCQGEEEKCVQYLLRQRQKHEQFPFFYWVGIFLSQNNREHNQLSLLKKHLIQHCLTNEKRLWRIFGPLNKMLERQHKIPAVGLVLGSGCPYLTREILHSALQWCKQHLKRQALVIEWDPKF